MAWTRRVELLRRSNGDVALRSDLNKHLRSTPAKFSNPMEIFYGLRYM